jgi:hypothetical protein
MGNNYLTITTSGEERILSVTINSPSGFTTLAQVRMSAAADAFVEIPEPTTLLSFGTGVIGLAGIMRRKLKLKLRM